MYDFNSNHNMKVRSIDGDKYPIVGETYTFDGIPFPFEFSIGVIITSMLSDSFGI